MSAILNAETRERPTQSPVASPTATVHWRLADDGSMSIVQSSGDPHLPMLEKSSELAEATIRTGLGHSCLLTSPITSMLIAHPIAHPIAGNEADCVTAAFDCELNEVNDAWTGHRVALLERIADSIETLPDVPAPAVPATVGRETVGRETVADDDSANINEPANIDEAALPTWKEWSLIAAKKFGVHWRNRKSNAKTTVAVVAVTLLAGLIPWPHKIGCNVICEPASRRYVAAPFDSRLLQTHVVIGQAVKAGELLATLDGGELRSQAAGVNAKLAQAQQREFAALSSGDHSKAEFERLEVTHLRHESELLQSRQSRLEIRSPVDGIVVTGDLERAVGAPLSVGDQLFEIAALDRLVAEMSVPAANIRFVENGMPVSVVLDSAPGETLHGKIERIHLRSEIRGHESVFIAETEFPNEGRAMRPGMNASAKINAGRQPLGWILLHRPFEALRQWIGW